MGREPGGFGEWVDDDTRDNGSAAIRLALGVNLLWDETLRDMLEVETVRPLGTITVATPWIAGETYSLQLATQI